jgi:hypothetical protein
MIKITTKLTSWVYTTVFMSIAWASIASFVYFDHLANYDAEIKSRPLLYHEQLHLNLTNYFEVVDDEARRDEALAYAESKGNGTKARMFMQMGFRFLKPTFSKVGFFRLVFLPIFLWWILANIVFIAQRWSIKNVKEKTVLSHGS